jgi:predicted site-specific integrase-resolvase
MSEATTTKPWMTPDEVRQYLGGISNSTLIRYRKAGLEPTYITPSSPRYHVKDVDEWILSRRRKSGG